MAIQDFNKFSTRVQVLEEVSTGTSNGVNYHDVHINGATKDNGSPYRLSSDAMSRAVSATAFTTELEVTSTQMSGILRNAVDSGIAFYASYYKTYKYSDAAKAFSDSLGGLTQPEILDFVFNKKKVSAFFKEHTQYGEFREGVFVQPNAEMKALAIEAVRQERFEAMQTLWNDSSRWFIVEDADAGGWTIVLKHKNGRKAMHQPTVYGTYEQANKVSQAIQSWIGDIELSDAQTDNPRFFSISSNGVVALETFVYASSKNAAKTSDQEIQGRISVADLSKPLSNNNTQITTSNVVELIWNGVKYTNKKLASTVK